MSITKRPWIPSRVPLAGPDDLISKEWLQYLTQLPQFSAFETPAGTIDGANKVFTLVGTPNPVDSLELFSIAVAAVTGTLQIQGLAYTLSGNTITYVTAPGVGSSHRARYRSIVL